MNSHMNINCITNMATLTRALLSLKVQMRNRLKIEEYSFVCKLVAGFPKVYPTKIQSARRKSRITDSFKVTYSGICTMLIVATT